MNRNVSPARSQGDRRPVRRAQRRSNSVSSARSNGSGRLTTLIQQHRNSEQQNSSTDSFVLTPPGRRRSILTNNTDIEDPRRKSWWNQIGENSTNILELENQAIEPNNVLQEMDIDILSQERKNYTMDLPESSDNETIKSIVIPQRKLFTQRENILKDRFGDFIGTRNIKEKKNNILELPDSSDCETIKSIVMPQKKLFNQRENVPQDRFGDIIGARETLAKLNDTKEADEVDKARTKNFFENQQNEKPFSTALLNISPEKSKDLITEEPTAPIHNLFGNRPTKRKNFYADFILAESEDEITDVVPKVFSFQKKFEAKRRASSSSRGMRDPSPTLSYTTDIEMDDWKLLPSSTMVEHQLEVLMADKNTPKKAMLSKLTEIESDRGSSATKQSDKSVLSKEEKQSRKSKTFTKEKSPDNSTTKKNKYKVLQEDAVIDNEGTAEIYRKSKTFTKEHITVQNEETDQNKSAKGAEQSRRSKTFTKDKISQVYTEEIFDQNKSTEGADKSRKSKTFTKEKAVDLVNSSPSDEQNNVDEELNFSLKYDDADQEMPVNKASESLTRNIVCTSNINTNLLNKVVEKSAEFESKTDKSLVNKNKSLVQENKVVENEMDQENQQNDPNEFLSNNKDCQINVIETEKSIQNQNVLKNINLVVNDKMGVENNLEQEEDNELNKDQDIEGNAENNEAMDQSEVLNESEVNEVDNLIENDQNESEVEEQNESQEEQNESEEEQNESQEEQNECEVEEQNESQVEQNDSQEEQNESQEEQNDSQEEQNESQEEQNESEVEEQNESEIEEQNECQEENEAEEIEHNDSETENQEESEAIAESDNEDSQEDVANESDHQGTSDQAESLVDDDQVIESGPDYRDNEIIETSNISHDTTGRNRKIEMPEAIRNVSNIHLDSSVIRGRNTTVRKSEMIKTINVHKQSQASSSTGFDSKLTEGSRNSSADRSEWDSHRVTRKTLRQTFGRDFTPRKSLRAMVMEKSANRQTQNDVVTHKFPLANSTELPETIDWFEDDAENQQPSEVSFRTGQKTLDTDNRILTDEIFREIQKSNREYRLKVEQEVRNMFAPQQPTSSYNIYKMPLKPVTRRGGTKPAPKVTKPKRLPDQLASVPKDLLEIMKYRPPKRFAPRDAPWATKRLYKYLEAKLEPKYDYKARVRAERLVESIYHFTKGLRRLNVADGVAVDTLKREMARLKIVKTHFEFYEFVRQFLPREVRIKVNPDIVNKIPDPKGGVFADIIS